MRAMRGAKGQRGCAGRVGRSTRSRPLASALTVLTVLTALTVPLSAQTIAERAAQVRDGKIRMSFATRPGVCGNGRNIHTSRHSEDWESDCDSGPARVVLTISGARLVDVDTYVGGRWREARERVVDLGMVPADEAAAYLLSLAATGSRAGKEAIFPATIADGVEIWPQLIDLARSGDVPRETRKSAVFWLGQAAGDAAAGDLSDLARDGDEDLEVREHAVFALSQLRGDRGVPALIEIARNHDDGRIRRKAMFWLGQSGDPRAIAIFEEILGNR